MRAMATIVMLLTMLSACSSRWVLEDGGEATFQQINNAQEICQVDPKRAAFEPTKQMFALLIQGASTQYIRQGLINNYNKAERKLEAEIEACMQSQGLKRI